MDLKKYKALLCTVEGGSLSAAAERLGCTTAGISRMIAVLEEENGFPLLIRNRNGVMPTADCERLIPAVRKLIYCEEQCVRLSEGIKELSVGQIVIGMAYSSDWHWLKRITEEFHTLFPEIEIMLYRENSAALIRLLEERKVDLCIAGGEVKNADRIPLRKEELAAWIPLSSPLSQMEKIPLKAFREENYISIRSPMDDDGGQILKKYWIRPASCLSAKDRVEILSMVGRGQGIAIQSRQAFPRSKGKICVRSLKPGQFLDIGIASAREPSMAAEKFMLLVKSNMKRYGNEMLNIV